jgi:hypothetical protein
MAYAEIKRLRTLQATHHRKLKAIAKKISTIDSMEDFNQKSEAIRLLKNESARWHVKDAHKEHTSLAPMHEYFSGKPLASQDEMLRVLLKDLSEATHACDKQSLANRLHSQFFVWWHLLSCAFKD